MAARMIAAACLGAMLGLPGLVGEIGLQAPAAAGAGVAGADEVDAEVRFKRALAELRARRFAAAAIGFESLWREGRSTKVLAFAAQAREGAGHWLHAIEHMRALLGADATLDARGRARLTARMAAARRHTAPLVVRLKSEEGSIGEAKVTLRRVAPDEVRPLLELAIEPHGPSGLIADGRVIDLDPGVWSLTVEAPGFRARQRVFAVMPRPRRGEAGLHGPSDLAGADEVEFSLELITVPTVLALAPEAAVDAGAQWTLSYEEGLGGGLRMIGGARAREQLSLVPGRWRARVEAPGYVAQEFTWEVGAGDPAPVAMTAEAPPPAPAMPPELPRARDPGLGLGLGLGLSGGVSFGVGTGLLIQHSAAYGNFRRAPDNAGFVAAVTGSAVGSAMVGAGLGLGIAALTSALPLRSGRRGLKNRGLWIELGVGGGVALITAAWYAREWQRVQRDLYGEGDTGMTAPDVKAQHRETTAAAVLGAGVGLAAGAGVALLTRHLVRRANTSRGLALGGGPGLIGLGVRGRF